MLSLQLQATPEEVMRAVEALQEFCQNQGIPQDVAFGLALALEECGSNIVNHALRDDKQQTFTVAVDFIPPNVSIELRDRGPEFDPTQAPEKPKSALDDEPPGGWGIALVRRYTDELNYKREAGQNVLRLTKRLAGPARST